MRIRVHSVSCGAVDALWQLAQEFEVPAQIDAALTAAGGRPRTRDGLTVGASLTAAAIARLCHPSSKRAVAEWAATTTFPRWLGVPADALTSQHFWDQMDAVPVQAVPTIEERLVQRVLTTEHVAPQVLAYDTTNFFTHLATTNGRSTLAQRGHSKQRRHDLRQLGLALVVSDDGQLPLGHVLYEGARPDAPTFAAVLAPLRARLHRLLAQTAQLTLVFDQGAETTANLAAVRAGGDHYVTALKPSAHRAWLATVVDQLTPVTLTSGEAVPAYRTRRAVHGVEQTVVVVRSAALADGPAARARPASRADAATARRPLPASARRARRRSRPGCGHSSLASTCGRSCAGRCAARGTAGGSRSRSTARPASTSRRGTSASASSRPAATRGRRPKSSRPIAARPASNAPSAIESCDISNASSRSCDLKGGCGDGSVPNSHDRHVAEDLTLRQSVHRLPCGFLFGRLLAGPARRSECLAPDPHLDVKHLAVIGAALRRHRVLRQWEFA